MNRMIVFGGLLLIAAAYFVGVVVGGRTAARGGGSFLEDQPIGLAQHVDERRALDLTWPFDSTTIYWPGNEPFHLTVVASGNTPGGWWYASDKFCASEHGGTHLDAPYHFYQAGWSVEAIPLERLMGPAVVVNVVDTCAKDPDYKLSVADIERFEQTYGKVPEGAIFLMRTGWGSRWRDRKSYLGSQTPDDPATLHFPGFSQEAAYLLAHDRKVDAVGLDTPSLDPGNSRDFVAHQTFGKANVPGLENVANLEQLPSRGAWVIALPMKIAHGTGGPARILAIKP